MTTPADLAAFNTGTARARAAYYARFCVNGCGRVTAPTPQASRCRTCIDKDKKK